ncbi:ExeM/NucH family extracellular endonuclease [Methyloversatilis sp.]|uniref:ExeM/NucH family extracellular endonuclease n=1 Tax=Methyloversatilis sp. TaxID=2569862 RepID=UPI0027368C68|nr:ExeM/NucH family extracellular endonuclease [Methyloversatilis sp.]MDP2870247.1 ExeM/NucH family extracellular endonuclease [Methyloversatilis sp.]MDP3456361.1 ExeM/NucH family extracellular endonuclease [Methyloversatilis sp.]MDP3579495.1 ExeM/NucH family extracellular endonuclease [Methyloversatilis sp.]
MSSNDRIVSPRLALTLAIVGLFASAAQADNTPQTLPFAQDWTNIGLITANDNWSGVPGITGYRGDELTSATGVDPQTITADGTTSPVDVNANQTNPNTFSTGGVTEFHLTDPVVALTGSGTADAPFILLSLNTTGHSGIVVRYDLRDLDGSADNAQQQVALQYRIGASGSFINVPEGYVADATEGPSLAVKVTPVQVTLPAAADNQPLLQLRVITTNAPGNDEWVGIDNISVQGGGTGAVNQPIVTTCPALAIQAGEAGSVMVAASDADSVVEAFSLTGALPDGVTVDGFAPATADGGSASAQVSVAAGTASGQYSIGLRFTNNEAQEGTCSVDITVAAPAAIVPIPAIQGSGDASPLNGQVVTTEGVVSAVFPGLSGYTLQDASGDGDVSTSDGIFVYAPGNTAIVGQRLRLTASVTEFNTVTQLTSPSAIQVLGSGVSITPTDIVLPEAFEGELERYEGMLVRIVSPLTVSQNYFQGRYGQVTLSAEGRLEIPTNRHPAGSAEALALRDENARRRIVLDDGRTAQNPNPIPFIGADNTLRAGDTVEMLTGVIDHGLITASSTGPRDYKIHPAVEPVFERTHPRTAFPEPVGGNVKVASFNVLNYFSTIDQAGASCFPTGTRSDCRGADSALEFTRQRDKIVAALRAMDADVVGLIEIENNGQGAVNDLVAALNAAYGANVYAAVGLPVGGSGTDAIRQAMIYKPTKVTPVGSAVSDTATVHSRPPLAQTFAAANGERFTVVVNHFKSKGCGDAAGAEADQGDGQGCWNPLRVQQAAALQTFIQQLPGQGGAADMLVIGDLNAYAKEDPILALTSAGLTDLAAGIELNYTYTFDGESGALDHALASAALAGKVSGVTQWHINTDEPFVIDYNTEFKPQDLYAPTAFRSSDHDPVIIGLNLLRTINGGAGRDTLTGTPGDDVITGGEGADLLTGGGGADTFVYQSVRDALDTITDFDPQQDRLDVRLLLAGVTTGSDPLTSGHISLRQSGANTMVLFDADGSAGRAAARPLVILRNVLPAQLGSATFLY